jgi:hypothetical protein
VLLRVGSISRPVYALQHAIHKGNHFKFRSSELELFIEFFLKNRHQILFTSETQLFEGKMYGAQTIFARIIFAQTIFAQTIFAQTILAQTILAQKIYAQTIFAQTKI